jgi:hypothetical protein
MITPRLDIERTSSSLRCSSPLSPLSAGSTSFCGRYEALLNITFQQRVQILSLEIMTKLKSIFGQNVGVTQPRSSLDSLVKLSISRVFVRQGIESLGFLDIDPSSTVVKLSEWMTGSGDGDDWYFGTLALAEGCSSRKSGAEVGRQNFMENEPSICRATSTRLCSFEWTLKVAHQVSLLLEHGCVCSTFKIEGISLAFVVHRWLSQCFWNYLPFDAILAYLDLRIQAWDSLAAPGGGDSGADDMGAARGVRESSMFVAAVLEHVVEKHLSERSSRRPPTLSLRDILVDGPLPSSVATSMWCDRKLWSRMERWTRGKRKSNV